MLPETNVESPENQTPRAPRLIAVNTSQGGIPRMPIGSGYVEKDGLRGDVRAHEKHRRTDRAISLLDYETVLQLRHEGFPVWPGRMGENLTVVGLGVQQLAPGTLLQIGEVVLQLEQPRKPCYVLDVIDPRLKNAVVGRCGYLASVIQPGMIESGARIQICRQPCEGEFNECRRRA